MRMDDMNGGRLFSLQLWRWSLLLALDPPTPHDQEREEACHQLGGQLAQES